jgi:hypothetical protein
VIYLIIQLNASLNTEFGGNAVTNHGNYQVIKPNTENHAVAFQNVANILTIVPIVVPLAVGRWRYRRYLASHRR